MKAKNIHTGDEFEITGQCNVIHEDETLWVAISYIDETGFTNTTEFPIDASTGEITHSDYILINE